MLTQSRFKTINCIMGWLAFIFASIIYCTTIEPSASLWDCSEFIISAYKLEVGHPPGAPFYMLLANLFSQFASTTSEVAKMVNLMSALLSAGCIMFLFWSISYLMRRLICGYKEVENWSQLIIIEGAALIGALTFTFTDSFWYSAVEAEVYAFSSFLTALVFWLILKWDEEADLSNSNRWLLLICYLIGISIGVHLLNLLCIPSMVLVYYFRKARKINSWGIIKSLLIGFCLLGGLLYILIPGTLWLAERTELIAVNTLSLPFNSGLLIFIVILSSLMTIGIWKLRGLKRFALQCVAFVLIGFSCYGVILIRSAANTPMDENSPEDVFALKKYLNREQYGETPLFYGPTYKSKPKYQRQGGMMVAEKKQGAMQYQKSENDGKYRKIGRKTKIVYEENMLFPRMHSNKHSNAYELWLGGVEDPTMKENLRFFLSYQVYFMYIRYFMWNFVGRQNDIPSYGEPEHGNWITGIDCIDSWILGCDVSKLPEQLQNNKGRNVYYGLPFLLGILGMWWQYKQKDIGRRQFYVVMSLFFMTGIAIVLYLNQTPMQARERDYSYAGSFYAFSIWIGLGVGAICNITKRICNNKHSIVSGLAAILLCLPIPTIIAAENWDDHDRSNRFACHDFGLNYLVSAQEDNNPIILSLGDNDTFPLWYHQEVEGNRTDCRVCNMSYACIDWYMEQMLRPAYDSPGLHLDWEEEDYKWGANDYVQIVPEISSTFVNLYYKEPHTMERIFGKEPFELKNILKHWVFNRTEGMSEDDIQLRKYVKALICGREHEWKNIDIRCIPTDSVYVTQSNGEKMNLSLSEEDILLKNDLMLLQLLSNTTQNRPVYVTTSMDLGEISYIKPYLSLEGLLYRIDPSISAKNDLHINTEVMYDNIMHKYQFGGLNNKNVYADYDVRKLAYAHQHKMAILIDALIREGKYDRALEVSKKWLKEYPKSCILYDETLLSIAESLYLAELNKEADEIVESLIIHACQWLEWYNTLNRNRRKGTKRAEYIWQRTLSQALSLTKDRNRETLLNKYLPLYVNYIDNYEQIHN